MKTIIMYELMKYKKNIFVLFMILIMTFFLSILERIPEISMLVLILVVPGVYGENKVDMEKTYLFETLMPVSVRDQIKGKYVVLLIKALLASTLYAFIYYVINHAMNIMLVKQLVLMMVMSIDMGVVIILKNMAGNRFKTPIYYILLFAIYSLLFVVDKADEILPFELPWYVIGVLFLLVILIVHNMTVAVVLKHRGESYDKDYIFWNFNRNNERKRE